MKYHVIFTEQEYTWKNVEGKWISYIKFDTLEETEKFINDNTPEGFEYKPKILGIIKGTELEVEDQFVKRMVESTIFAGKKIKE